MRSLSRTSYRGFCALLVELFLKDRDLHFELVDPVFEKEDLLGFGVGIPAGQAFQASLAHPSRESSRQQGGSDEQGDGGIEDVEILCHGALSEVWGAIEAQSKGIL